MHARFTPLLALIAMAASIVSADVVTQDFGDFTQDDMPQTTTVNDWFISETYILHEDALGWPAPAGEQYALLPDSGQDSGVTGTNSYVETPLLTNGVGTLNFEMGTAPLGGSGEFIAEVWVGDASNDWQFAQAFTNDAAGSTGGEWISRTVTLDRYDPVRLQIRKGGLTTDSSWVGIDDIRITYPPAYVTAGGFQIHPAYPSQTEPVDISATIESVTDYHPAFNIAGQIYYREVGASSWSAPLAMTRNGNYFRTATGIPPHVVTSEIEYYLQTSFAGYHGPGENRSPMPFAPDDPVYTIRRHASDYTRLTASVGGHEQAFRQSYDGTWETMLDFRTPVTDTHITVDGFDFYDGTNVMDGLSVSWGDPDQDWPTLPYVGVMQPDAAPLIMEGTHTGQFLLRFNEVDRTYTLLRAAWQPFDDWLASADFFEAGHSADSAGIITQPFAPALWPASAYTTTMPNEFRSDDFEGDLGNMSDYAYQYPLSAAFNWGTDSPDNYQYITESGIGIQRGVIITQRVGRAVMLRPVAGTGRMRTSPTPMKGVGSVSFEVRAVDGDRKTNLHAYSDTPSRENLMFEARIEASEIADSQEDITLGHSYLAMVARYQNADNHYELRLAQINATQYQIQLWSVKDGTRAWVNGLTRNGSIMTPRTYRLILSTYTHGGIRTHYEVREDGIRRFWGDDTTARTVPGYGQFGFQALDAGMIVDNVVVGNANMQRTRGWPTTQNYVTIREHDGWRSEYAYIHSASPGEGFRMRPYDPLLPPAVLRSPPMADGLGLISFQYRRQGDGAARLFLEYSTDGDEWTQFDTVNVTSTRFVNYNRNAGIEQSNVYFRIVHMDALEGTPSRTDIRDIFIEPNRNLTYREVFNAAPDGWGNSVWTWNSTHNDYRVVGYTADPLSLSIDFSVTDDEGAFSSIATVSGITNTAYTRVSQDIHQAANGFLRIRHTGGDASLIIDNLDISPWRARDAEDTNGWAMAKGWVTDYAPDPRRHAVAMTRSRAPATDPQYILGPWMTNGVGHIEFEYLTSGSGAFELLLQTTPLQNPTEADWNTVSTITTLAPDDWRRFGYAIEQAGNLRVRLLHTSTSPDRTVAVDSIELRDFVDVDDLSWVAYNALISDRHLPVFLDDYSDPASMKSGFLNSGPGIYGDTPTNFTAHLPYIESPYLADGIGEVRFWYNRAAGSEPARLVLKTAPSRETPDQQWAPLAEINGIDHPSYAQFDQTFFVRDHHFLRIYNDTNTASRVGLDNILITAPYGATLTVKDVTLDPAIPLLNQPVHIEVSVTNFFLAPSNITMRAYWKSGTNAWGSLTNMSTIAMHVIDETPDYRRFRTDTPIPGQAIDAVVQYLVSAEFEGLFSDKSSPYYYRTFTNPSWYEPVNLNTDQATPIPYYYTFSCLPGHVWFNEVNIAARAAGPDQFVEIAGRSDSDIGKWHIAVLNNFNALQASYQIQPGTTLPSVTNHYGFWVLGKDTITERNLTLTNTIPNPGGLQLVRSMGAVEQAITFGSEDLVPYGFVYIGNDVGLANRPLHTVGVGSTMADFQTWERSGSFSIGGINPGQVLVPWHTENGGDDPDGPPLRIDSFWVDTNQIPPRVTFLVQGNTNNYVPRPFYSTNLLSGTWTEAPNADHTRDGTTYTVWGDLMTGPNGVFYRIEDTAP